MARRQMTAELAIGQKLPLTLQEMAALQALAEVPKPYVGPLKWRVLLTEPSHESVAAAGFVGRAWRIFCPVIWKRVPTRGRVALARKGHQRQRPMRDVLVPLFPGYLLIELPDAIEAQEHAKVWNRVRDSDGVRDFLRFGEHLAHVPARLIDVIRVIQVETQFRGTVPPVPVGKDARIKDGPFEAFAARVIKIDSDRARAKALVDFLGALRLVEFDWAQLEPL
jgi:transcription antitermination factor NusG